MRKEDRGERQVREGGRGIHIGKQERQREGIQEKGG